MEKLIMLIDIYEEEVVWVHSVWDKIIEKDEARIISKQFWFIKWLLDQEKIDLLRLSCTAIRYTEIIDADFSREDIIIMILAIQCDPINFLISYLK